MFIGFSSNQAEDIFRANQTTIEADGERALFSVPVDMDMVRNSIVPFSIAQRLCCEWLRTYFLNYGEMSPNSKETKLNQGKIKEQYHKYGRER